MWAVRLRHLQDGDHLLGQPAGFAGAKPKAGSLDGYLDLQRRVEDPRIRRASPYTKRLVVHQFRISAPEQLDAEFAGWVGEAYQVGQGGHLGSRPGPTG